MPAEDNDRLEIKAPEPTVSSVSRSDAFARGLSGENGPSFLITRDQNAELMKKIFSKLAMSLSIASNDAKAGQVYLSLENPGTFIEPGLKMTNVSHLRRISDLLNPVPVANWIYQPTTRLVSSLYERIINDKELPIHELSSEQRKQLNKALKYLWKKYLVEQSAEYQTYDYYYEKYWEARSLYDTDLTTANNEGRPPNARLFANMQEAERRWKSLGNYNSIRAAMATIANLQGLDPNIWWGELASVLSAAKTNDGGQEFYPSRFNPSYDDVMNSSSGWSTFTFTAADWENQSYHEHTSSGGGLSVNFGLWRANAGASYEEDKGFVKTTSEAMTIEVEVKRVNIQRSWLEGLVFYSRAWRWSKGVSWGPISTGDQIGQTMPSGLMPLVPTAIILARKVRISANFSTEERNWINTQLTANASFGWGPFSIGGNYSKSTEYSHVKGSLAGNTVTSDHVQIIGWLSDVIPQCPWPDPVLKWPSKLTIADLPQYSTAFIEQRRAELRGLGWSFGDDDDTEEELPKVTAKSSGRSDRGK